jgi:hypothetical protein
MGENSKIEWCRHTFNPWIGCQEMSAACDNCYARVLATFKGMPDVKRGMLRGPMVDSVNGFMVALRKHRICSAAGDDGAVNVYRADDGTFRCSFCRYLSYLDNRIFDTKADVRKWLKVWLPKRYEFH